MPKIEIIDNDKLRKQFLLLHGDSKYVLKKLPENFIHTVITSPPYWRLRDYFTANQLGQESTPEEYVKNLVDICKEIKKVLRKDGTFWLNLGDSYNNSSGFERATDIKIKDLIGIPWMVAFALRKDGWYLRCDIIYSKTNPMPDGAKDRPTRSHEYIFLLTKSSKYFYDYYRVLEDTDEQPEQIQGFGANEQHGTYRMDQNRTFEHYGKRNKRSVWVNSVSSFKGNHFGTYPFKLIEPCVKASTSAKGCCVECGSPWIREFEKEKEISPEVATDEFHINMNGDQIRERRVLSKKGYTLKLIDKGWIKGCNCDTNEIKPCVVLDPFNGSGTTCKVAFKYDQYYIGVDTNEEYLDISRKNIKENKRHGDDGFTIVEAETIESFLDD